MNPAKERAEIARKPTGRISSPGVSDLIGHFLDPSSVKSFSSWSNEPITKLVKRAVQDLSMTYESGASDPAVQYGVSIGLSLAFQLMDDPSVIYPAVFGGGAPAVSSTIDTNFGTSTDSALDTLE